MPVGVLILYSYLDYTCLLALRQVAKVFCQTTGFYNYYVQTTLFNEVLKLPPRSVNHLLQN